MAHVGLLDIEMAERQRKRHAQPPPMGSSWSKRKREEEEEDANKFQRLVKKAFVSDVSGGGLLVLIRVRREPHLSRQSSPGKQRRTKATRRAQCRDRPRSISCSHRPKLVPPLPRIAYQRCQRLAVVQESSKPASP